MPKPRDRDELRSHHWRDNVVPAVIRLYGTVCHLCNQAIDMSIKSPHPLSFSVDHIRGAATGMDLRYLRPAHRGCNMKQGNPVRSDDPRAIGTTRWR